MLELDKFIEELNNNGIVYELIEPDEYLIWHQLKDEYQIEQYLKEYEPIDN